MTGEQEPVSWLHFVGEPHEQHRVTDKGWQSKGKRNELGEAKISPYWTAGIYSIISEPALTLGFTESLTK